MTVTPLPKTANADDAGMPLSQKISSRSTTFSVEFMPAAGSSSAISCGSVASARAISSRRWSPYESVRAL